MRTTEWANTDSRIAITVRGREVTVHVVYERDTYLTDDAAVTMSTNEFFDLMHNAERAIVNEAMRSPSA
jgi:hypothetical protein